MVYLKEMARIIFLLRLFLKVGHSQPFFSILVFSIILLVDKILLMTGFEPRIYGVGSGRCTNSATTSALLNA